MKVLVSVVLLSLLRMPTANPASAQPSPTPQMAGDFMLLTSQGDSLQLSSLRGRVVLLNFWATWCKPCLEEMPDLNALHEELSPAGLTVVGFAVDGGARLTVEADGTQGQGGWIGLSVNQDDRRIIDRFADRLGVIYPVVYGSVAAAQSVLGGNAVPILPTTLVIDQEGRVTQRIVGTVPIEETKRSLQTMLQQ